MPCLIDHHPPRSAEVCPIFETDELAYAEGSEGQQLRERINSVSQHWEQQMYVYSSDSADDQIRHVPFAKVGTRKVRYVRIKPMKPRQIVFDEDD